MDSSSDQRQLISCPTEGRAGFTPSKALPVGSLAPRGGALRCPWAIAGLQLSFQRRFY